MTGVTVQTGTCECGNPASREIPDSVTGHWRDRLESFPLVCQECEDRREAEHEAERGEAAQRQAVDRLDRRLDVSGLPAALHGLPVDPMVPSAARAWADARILGLLLTGPVGVGKTHLAAGLAWAHLQRAALRWTSAPLLFARLGSGLGSDTREEALATLTANTALVIDDLDKARPTEYGAENVFVAIDQRVTHGVPLIVTMNLTLAELARKFPEPYGEAIASRLAGYCEHARLDGEDRRLT